MDFRLLARGPGVVALGVCLALACSSEGKPPDDPGAIGTARIALATVPVDVACVVVTAAGNRTVTRAFTTAPGTAADLAMDGLPLGEVRFSAEAFAVGCAMIAGATPTWTGDPVTTVLVRGQVARVTLVLRRSGGATVTVDFEDAAAVVPDAAVDAPTPPPDATDAEPPPPDATDTEPPPPDTGVDASIDAPAPPIGITCTTERDCPTREACVAGRCSSTCDAQSPCNGGCCAGGLCQSGRVHEACGFGGGACATCNETDRCTCGACQQICKITEDCPVGLACDPDTGTCSTKCTDSCNGACCAGGTCQPGTANAACGSSGQCRDCTTAGSGSVCMPGGTHCGCATDADCPAGVSCDVALGACRSCKGPKDCPPGLSCDPSTGVCSTTCDFERPCNGGCCDARFPQTGLCNPGTAGSTCGNRGGLCGTCGGFGSAGSACRKGATCGCAISDCPGAGPAGGCDRRTGQCRISCSGLRPCPTGMCCDVRFNVCVPGDLISSCGSGGNCVTCGKPYCEDSFRIPINCWGSVCHKGGACSDLSCGPEPPPPDFSGLDPLPSPTRPATGGVVQLALGIAHSCALFANGSVVCWGTGAAQGHGNTDVIGDDETPATTAPVDIGGPVVALSAGGAGTCAVLERGRVRCWGSAFGLGYPDRANDIGDDETPASVGDLPLERPAVQMALAWFSSCALLDTGVVRCFGNGTLYRSQRGAIVPLGGRAVRLGAGGFHACALLSSAGVRCWGANAGTDGGALGYGHPANIGDDESPADIGDVPLGARVLTLAAGERRTCAETEDGVYHCWGAIGTQPPGVVGPYPRIGDDEPASDPRAIVDAGARIWRVAIGNQHTCVLVEGGVVRCWHDAPKGQTGHGNTLTVASPSDPAAVVDLGGPATDIAAGAHHTCAIMEGGKVRCWGEGRFGALGYGNTQNVGDDETPASVGDVQLGAR